MEKGKILNFKWELGEVPVSLHVGSYMYGGGLYIGLTSHADPNCPEPFADMTVNIPMCPLAKNEACINNDISKDLIRFIKKNHLGQIQERTVSSGYCVFKIAAFDLDKLKEFDEKGVSRFLAEYEE